LVEKGHRLLSVRKQCELLGVARSKLQHQAKPPREGDLEVMRILDEIYLKDPCLGSRRLAVILRRDYQLGMNRKRLQRLRRLMGVETIYCRPRTSVPGEGHQKMPYLLRGVRVESPDEVWCADITYVPMERGFGYLCVVMDWYSRKVLGWRLSNTMDTSLCLAALEQAFVQTGREPKIFNTDQGSQFTSREWQERLEAAGVQISMDGRGRWMDNVFIERLWRSLKYEEIYLRSCATLAEQEEGIARWIEQYNEWRPHQALGYVTPAEVYAQGSAVNPQGGSEKVLPKGGESAKKGGKRTQDRATLESDLSGVPPAVRKSGKARRREEATSEPITGSVARRLPPPAPHPREVAGYARPNRQGAPPPNPRSLPHCGNEAPPEPNPTRIDPAPRPPLESIA
jgi:putative transposase